MRARVIEQLENRQVMSADPVSGSFAGSGHDIETPIALIQHAAAAGDFWIDSWSERDVETFVGDVHQTLASAHKSTGLTDVRNDYGFTGAGQTVAVIDSGIAWSHSALGGGLGAGYRVVGGWDFAENDADPYDDGPWGSHGTHVAGIIGADAAGANYDGVATGADIVGLRVFDDAGAGYLHWVENALRWVHENRYAFENPITAVNLSLGTAWNSSTIPSWTTLEDEFAQLAADGIFIAVSAGNSFATYNALGLSYPAASPSVVPVMSVTDNGSLSAFSQRHTRAIAAPGQYIVSAIPDYVGDSNGVDDDFASFSGTSMAAPYVTGASMLLREAMQFVGYTNITQDTIYNHIMSTATSFFDAATGQTFKRINLTNAFGSLMPTDEYGSTAAEAHDLGTLGGESEISGLISTLGDLDFFRFTAAATGTVTFTATATHGLVPVWTATGGTVSGDHGEMYRFDVVAGQLYTIGLSTSSGIGYYDLAVEAESAFTFTDLGTITQSRISNVANGGETWYRVTASRTGHFTTEVLFAAAGGNIDVAMYDSNMQLLAAGSANAVGERVDILATAGTSYLVRVTGTNADVDFRLTNLVSQVGATVNVSGSSGNDSLTFAVGSSHYTVIVNGVTYKFKRANVSKFDFTGEAGSDSITMRGSTGDDVATLRAGSTELVGGGYAAVATGVEKVIVHGGGGANDVANLHDTAGNDRFTTWWSRAVMHGSGYWNDARGFDRVCAYASGGTDKAWFRDSVGDDVYETWSDRSVMRGNGFWNEARGFDRSYALASSGNDEALFHDSVGNDVFTTWWDRAVMHGVGYWNDARGFDRALAHSTSGNDLAVLRDSSAYDEVHATENLAYMTGASYRNEARGFRRVDVYDTDGNISDVVYIDSIDFLFHSSANWTRVGV